MKEPGKLPQEGSPPGMVRPAGAGEATNPIVVPHPHGLIFLIAVLKKVQAAESLADERPAETIAAKPQATNDSQRQRTNP